MKSRNTTAKQPQIQIEYQEFRFIAYTLLLKMLDSYRREKNINSTTKPTFEMVEMFAL